MNREFYKSISFAIVIVSVSISFYLFWYLPKQNKVEHTEKLQKELLVNQQKCQQVASEKYEKESKELESVGAVAFNPQYKYEETLSSCIYLGGLIGQGQTEYFITDVYTNKTIADYFTDKNNIVILGDKNNFDKLKLKYFGE